MENLVVADLRLFTEGTPQDRNRFIETLGQAFHDIGFIIIQNHYLPADLQAALYEKVEAFFRLPDEVKARYIVPNTAGQRGYTPKNREHAKDRTVPDLKEFFHVGPEITDP
jgi:isopenicillin N synthase-like dioxygenase